MVEEAEMTDRTHATSLAFFSTLMAALGFFSMAVPASAAGPAYAHDPFVIKQGDTYYLFATGQGISVMSSPDLIDWKYESPAFLTVPKWAKKEVPGFNGHIWAPDVSLVNGKYYMYYSVSTFGSNRSCIGLAINKTLDPTSPDFEWVDQEKVIESFPGRDDFNAIDPNLAADGAGRYFLSFGSFWGGIKMVEIDPQTGKPLENPPKVIPLATRLGVQYNPIEAPFILKENDWYYLFVSWDFCCRGVRSDYKIAVGRSREITGPYKDKKGRSMLDGGGTIVLEGYGDVHGPGHNMVLRDGARLWLMHHYYDGTRGGAAIMHVRPLTWTEDGWPVAGDPLTK
jgi:arabinan endo-1,5-alpha-L-arabinosidase